MREVERLSVNLSFLLSVYRVHDSAARICRAESNVAFGIAYYGDRTHTRKRCVDYCRSIAVGNGADSESETVAVAKCTVGFKRTALSTAGTSQSGYFSVEVEINSVALYKLIGVGRYGKLLLAPRKCRGRHYAIGNERCSVSIVVGEGAPANFFTVTHGLRLRKHDVLFAHDAFMTLYELSGLTVGIVIYRSASVVFKVLQCCRQFHYISYARQYHVCLVGRDSALKFYASVRIDGVNLCGEELEVVFAQLLHAFFKCICLFWSTVAVAVVLVASFFALAFYGEAYLQSTIAFRCQDVRFAYYTVLQVVQTILEPCFRISYTSVVIGRRTEGIELRSVAVGYDALCSVCQFADSSCKFIELHAETCAGYAYRVAFAGVFYKLLSFAGVLLFQ